MWSIFRKEINAFFSSPIAYFVMGSFLLVLGLIMWVFPDYSLLEYHYATLEQLFSIAPIIFAFLVPAICMRLLSEERQLGTLELLMTKPISDWKIIWGKYFAAVALLICTLLPTLVYYYSVYQLGSPQGNIDAGGVLGSYLGLVLLGMSFAAIGIYSSSWSKNQIVAFIIGVFLCFTFYWAFYFMSKFPVFIGKWDDLIQQMGMDYHYASISRGLVDSRDIIYFGGLIFFFLYLTRLNLKYKRS